MKVGIAQINSTVGDFDGNSSKILAAFEALAAAQADIVVTPELCLVGYPPQDLVFKSDFVSSNLNALERLRSHAAIISPIPLIVGFLDFNPTELGAPFYNSAAVLQRGSVPVIARKMRLPTYDVFDEARYFAPGKEVTSLLVGKSRIGLTICEDVWSEEFLDRRYPRDPVAELVAAGCDLILNLSASPFNLGKPSRRLQMLRSISSMHRVPIVYCNAVGGNDQLVFDGTSIVVRPSGEATALASFKEDTRVVDFDLNSDFAGELSATFGTGREEIVASLHDALVLGLRDYMNKCGFCSAVLGLSGGIDSAVTACLAVAALGRENVMGVAMPSRFSSQSSLDDAKALALNLGIRFEIQSIEATFQLVKSQLAPAFAPRPEDATEENIQARLRGLILMAYSNKFGHLLLTTGNKSELAVGYCTLYGDMSGGLAVLSDVPKTRVYDLAKWINREREIIPNSSISKPPSAELRPNQTDQDTLPPYDILDEILRLSIEEHLSAREISERGFQRETVDWVLRKVRLNEYKRQQAAPGLKVTSKAFGFGRRMPVAQAFAG